MRGLNLNMKKTALLLSILIISILFFGLNEYNKKSSLEGLTSAYEKFNMYSFAIGQTDPIISIVINDNENEIELQKYLKKNIKKSELKNYDIEIHKRSSEEELNYSNS